MIREKVDEILCSSASVREARSFLEGLLEELKKARKAAADELEQLRGVLPLLSGFKQRLIEAIQHQPNPLAVASKYTMIALLAFFMIHTLFTFLRQQPQPFVDPSYLPGFWWLVFLFVGLDGLVTFLTLKAHDWRLLERRREYIEAVEEKHRKTMELQARMAVKGILDGLVGVEGSVKLGEIPEEIRRLEAFNASIEQAIRQLREPSSLPSSPVRRSILERLRLSQEYAYKNGEKYSLKEEMKDFVRQGFQGWRTLTTEDLTEHLLNFCRKGFGSLHKVRLENLIMQSTDEGRRRELFEELRERSACFLGLAADAEAAPSSIHFLGLEGGDSPFVRSLQDLNLLEDVILVPSRDRHRITYCQFRHSLQLGWIKGVDRLKEGYERWVGKEELHTVEDLQALPDPFASLGR